MSSSREQLTRPVDETAIASMFDRISGRYDLLNRLLSVRQDVRWRNKLLSMVPYRPEGRFLDVATGTGDVVLAATKLHPEYDSFIGCDISQGMLRLAEKKSSEANANQIIEWRKMSAEQIDVATSSCDCVTISFGLRNVVNKERALNEFARVLKTGGVLLILEFFTPQGGMMSRFFQFYFHYVLPIIGRVISEKEAYKYLPTSVASFYSQQELRDSLKNKGFLIDREVDFLFGSCRLVKARRI